MQVPVVSGGAAVSYTFTPLSQALIAGALAGAAEHVFTFPFDTVKTQMQVASQQVSSRRMTLQSTISHIVRTEGTARLYRGLSAIVVGAVPSHALYFATYEFTKRRVFDIKPGMSSGNHPTAIFFSGAAATIAHDLVVTPVDVIKQRMQMENSKFRRIGECARHVYRTEGISAFLRSYPTTVLMNIPFQGAYFLSYETVKTLMSGSSTAEESTLTWLVSGFIAGAVAGMLSLPFDVVKTRIQTTEGFKGVSPMRVARGIVKIEGFNALLRGAGPRIMVCAPAAATCWTVYETMKRTLGWEIDEEYVA